MKEPKAKAEEPKKLTIADRERETLEFWRTNGTFTASLERGEGKEPYVFYDGPPFATGLPHYGHLLQGTIKDIIPRYQTMKGRAVRRVWGWDCHGLPIENIVEGELGLKHKKDIEVYGVQNFNEKARGTVMRYADEWKEVVPRTGRWVDMDKSYRTMDSAYTESVWWAFKRLYDKGLIYEGYKSMHLCPRCETTLAVSEVALGYKDVKDISVYVKFKLKNPEKIGLSGNVYMLAWTTTPWTLPGNVALAVGSDIEYFAMMKDGETYIVSTQKWKNGDFGSSGFLARVLRGSEATIVGRNLVGLEYEPVFDSYIGDKNLKNRENGWKVVAGDFVTTDSGTGIVHIAPAFGEDDMKLGEKESLPFIQHVGTDGVIKPEVKELAGMEVKPKGEDKVRLATDIAVLKYLQEKGSFFAKENITHSYPHCWRCDTPLLNYAATSWFVKVTAIKDELVSENKKITWIPEHIRDGRFGNWLENARDWAISRTRYWGAPLPVWRCKTCKESTVAGSLTELRANMSHRNTYIIMRHGEAESNAQGFVNGDKKVANGLTEKGRKMVAQTALELKDKTIDLIIASPFPRTKETAEMIAEEIGYDAPQIKLDDRLGEIWTGEFEGKPIGDYRGYFTGLEEKFSKRPKGGETLVDVRKRAMQALEEIDREYEGKTILIVTHEYPAWMLTMGSDGLSVREAVAEKIRRGDDFLPPAGHEELKFVPLPHNDDYELDFHRPYIDRVVLHCHCGGDMVRIPDVFDCWFESGSMPYAQFHYLGNDTTEAGKALTQNFPADFIAEAVDQTRGWFYNMLVLSVGLFGKSAFRHVICTGLILAEDGQKMSKKLKNYPDPMDIVSKYGADALRLYMVSSPVVRGENLNFSTAGIDELYKKVLMRTDNVRAFAELYGEKGDSPRDPKSAHVLDRWIIARTAQLCAEMSAGLDRYELDVAVRPIAQYVDDLSTWYLRRSRERMKEKGEDQRLASETLRYVLSVFARVTAPVMPFYAEDLYRAFRGPKDPESVHLCAWPEVGNVDNDVLEQMAEVRRIVSLALESRAAHGIKIRQPLQKISLNYTPSFPSSEKDEYMRIICDEVNVKEIAENQSDQQQEVSVDPTITPLLKAEGQLRGLVRAIQEMRKGAKLHPDDEIVISLKGKGDKEKIFLSALPDAWTRDVRATLATTGSKGTEIAGEEITIDDLELKVSLLKPS